jgi:hypothetical protein
VEFLPAVYPNADENVQDLKKRVQEMIQIAILPSV